MRKILLILCTLFFAMVFISCNNEDKNIPSKPTETDWEEIEESCTETISGVEEFDFSVGEWEYYQYVENDEIWKDGKEAKLTLKYKNKFLIKETEDGKKVCYTGFEAETSYTCFPQEYYMEMKSYFENEYVPDGDNTVLVKLEFLDEACTIFLVEEDSAYTYEESYADFIDDFGRKNGMHKYITNEDKSVLLYESSSEFETNEGAHHKWTKKEFYVKK